MRGPMSIDFSKRTCAAPKMKASKLVEDLEYLGIKRSFKDSAQSQ